MLHASVGQASHNPRLQQRLGIESWLPSKECVRIVLCERKLLLHSAESETVRSCHPPGAANKQSYSPHATDALVPAFDDTASAKLKCDWVIAVQAAVKLGPISELALHRRGASQPLVVH